MCLRVALALGGGYGVCLRVALALDVVFTVPITTVTGVDVDCVLLFMARKHITSTPTNVLADQSSAAAMPDLHLQDVERLTSDIHTVRASGDTSLPLRVFPYASHPPTPSHGTYDYEQYTCMAP